MKSRHELDNICQMAIKLCNDASNTWFVTTADDNRSGQVSAVANEKALQLYDQSIMVLQQICFTMDDEHEMITNKNGHHPYSEMITTAAGVDDDDAIPSSNVGHQQHNTNAKKDTFVGSYTISIDSSLKKPVVIHHNAISGEDQNQENWNSNEVTYPFNLDRHSIMSQLDHTLATVVLYNLGLLYMSMTNYDKALEVWNLIEGLLYPCGTSDADNQQVLPNEFIAIIALKIGETHLQVYGESHNNHCAKAWNSISRAVELVISVATASVNGNMIAVSIFRYLGWILLDCGKLECAIKAFEMSNIMFFHNNNDLINADDENLLLSVLEAAPAA